MLAAGGLRNDGTCNNFQVDWKPESYIEEYRTKNVPEIMRLLIEARSDGGGALFALHLAMKCMMWRFAQDVLAMPALSTFDAYERCFEPDLYGDPPRALLQHAIDRSGQLVNKLSYHNRNSSEDNMNTFVTPEIISFATFLFNRRGFDPNSFKSGVETNSVIYHVVKQNSVELLRHFLRLGVNPRRNCNSCFASVTEIAANSRHICDGLFMQVLLLAAYGAKLCHSTSEWDQFQKHCTAENVAAYNAIADWSKEMRDWSPLRVAVASGLPKESTTALRLGNFDPDRIPIPRFDRHVELEHQETRDLAAHSPIPWGGRWVPNVDDSDETEQLRSELVQFARLATSGWSPQAHWLHHRGVRDAIKVLLLISERLYQNSVQPELAAAPASRGTPSTTAAPDPGQSQHHQDDQVAAAAAPLQLLPLLPQEMWLHIGAFFCRSFWPVPRFVAVAAL